MAKTPKPLPPIMTKMEKRQLMYSPKIGVMPFTKEEFQAALPKGKKASASAKKTKSK